MHIFVFIFVDIGSACFVSSYVLLVALSISPKVAFFMLLALSCILLFASMMFVLIVGFGLYFVLNFMNLC